jgi:exo-1,4-beta-D-glucosaminidase
VSSSIYWVSRRAETLDFPKTKGHDTPVTQYADYKDLAKLAQVSIQAHATSDHDGGGGRTQVTLENTSSKIAFFIRLKLMRGGTGNGSGEQVLPVLWEDNYVSLLPGEKKQLTAKYKLSDLQGAPPAVEVRGWNVARAVLD